MAKTFADVPKFKRLEAAMRGVPNAVRLVLSEIDTLSAGKRTNSETAALEALREHATKLHAEARAFYSRVMDVVDA